MINPNECPICCDEIIASDKAVCLDCGGILHKTCWDDFVKTEDTRITGADDDDDDPWDPSNGHLVTIQCIHCRAPAARVVRIGTGVSVPPPTAPRPVTAPQPQVINHWWDRYKNSDARPCKKCEKPLPPGHYGNYCKPCHQSYRTWGSRGAPAAVTAAQQANPTGRRCSKCRAPGHTRRNCPN